MKIRRATIYRQTGRQEICHICMWMRGGRRWRKIRWDIVEKIELTEHSTMFNEKSELERPKTIITIFTLELKLPTVLLSLTFFPCCCCCCCRCLYDCMYGIRMPLPFSARTDSFTKQLRLPRIYLVLISFSRKVCSLIQSFVHHYHNKLYEVIYVYNDSQ